MDDTGDVRDGESGGEVAGGRGAGVEPPSTLHEGGEERRAEVIKEWRATEAVSVSVLSSQCHTAPSSRLDSCLSSV